MPTATMTADSSPPLDDPEFHRGDPFPAFRALRAKPGLHWHEQPGFWAATRHQDVIAISRAPETFCSSRGILLSDLTREIVPRSSITYIDPPEHAKYRKLVQPAFTPGRLRALEQYIRATARRLLDAIEPMLPLDLVDRFAAELPIVVIAEMLGVPSSDRERFKRWSDAIIEAGTEQTPENMAQTGELVSYFLSIIAERRLRPGEDLISTLAHSQIDGERLEDFDLVAFCLTLLVAGNETTRNLISHGVLALGSHPSQLDRLVRNRNLLPNAIEEMLRWGTPVGSFMRTATRDVLLRDTRVREGDRLLMLYASANRDEAVFGPDAEEFRVDRDASGHVAFGFGEHFCLGAALARLEARVAFEDLLARFTRIEIAGRVERLRSIVIRGIVRLPIVLSR
jgi:cytochrome P450